MTARYSRFAIALLLVTLVHTIAIAQTEAPQASPWVGPAFSIDVATAQKLAASVAPDKYAHATVFLDERVYAFDAAGKLTRTRHLIYRVETPDGVSGWSNTGGGWEPWHEKRPEVRARVITPDGQVHVLDPKTLKDSPARDDVPETYSDDRVYGGPLPALAVGAIAEEEVVNQDTEPFFAGGYTQRVYVGRFAPVMYSRVVIEAPASLPLRYKLHLLPDAKVRKEESGGMVKITIEQGRMDALERAEPNLPPDVPDYPQVELATGKSWKDVAEIYRKMSEPSVMPEEVASLVAKDGGKGVSREEAIRKIVAQLHANVRYTGIEFGEAKLVPQSPAEVLKRKYGDCKDKATMLVSMLRAAKIPAYLALLDMGPGQDVNSEMPGMGLFDHAIVYVPGSQDLWIDATAEYTKPGDLPYGDQGREALIIRDGETSLTRTPEMSSAANSLVETREFHLAEFGPAKIVETSVTTGSIAASYRAAYGKPETKEMHKDLENYVESTYLADSLTKMEHGDGADMAKPFYLRLDMDKGTRGFTAMADAAVVVAPYSIIRRLPNWLLTTDESEKKSNDEATAKPKKPRTADVVFEPFVTEWRYEVSAPADFRLRGLPDDQAIAIGPGKFTEHFERKDNGALAILRFDSVKGRYTAIEAQEAQKAIKQFQQMNYTVLTFDEVGASLMASGKVRESLQSYGELVKTNPNDAIYCVRYANALLKAGVGDHAKAEAKRAAELDPKSEQAFAVLGWILQHDSIGRRFGKGFDYAGAVAAYRKAKELDPKDAEVRENLAILLEYGENGDRYQSQEHLAEAEKEYWELAKADEKAANSFKDNLLYVLYYEGKYKDLLAEVAKVSRTPARNALAAASVAAMDGSKAALQYVNQIGGETSARNTVISNAGTLLVRVRKYQLAAELLDEVARGLQDSTGISAQADMLRKTHRFEDVLLPPTDPRSAVQHLFTISMGQDITIETLRQNFAKNSFAPGAEEDQLEEAKTGLGQMRAVVEESGLPAKVMMDLILSHQQYSVEGSDEIGYRIGVRSNGAAPETAYVVKEDGVYKLLSIGKSMEEIGREVLQLVSEKKLAAARTWLDWQREAQPLSTGDDPLDGPVFPRLWTKGMQGNENAIKVAAASLVAGSRKAEVAADILRSASEHAATPEERTKDELALALADQSTENWKELLAVSERLLKTAPNSPTALRFLANADWGLKDWSAWRTETRGLTQGATSDPALVRVLARQAQSAGDFARARTLIKALIDSGRGTNDDLNMLAWGALFEGKVDQEAVEAARQANLTTQNRNYAILHTLACLYAETGNYIEAQQLLLAAMKAAQLGEPNDAIWYGYGRLYEQYGEMDAAAAAYEKVKRPRGTPDPLSTYLLAQKGLQRLGKVQETAAKR